MFSFVLQDYLMAMVMLPAESRSFFIKINIKDIYCFYLKITICHIHKVDTNKGISL